MYHPHHRRHLTGLLISALSLTVVGSVALADVPPPNPFGGIGYGGTLSNLSGSPGQGGTTSSGQSVGSGGGSGASQPQTCGGNLALCANQAAWCGAFAAIAACTPAGPGITPQQLMQQALYELKIPKPQILTAPPRGTDGVVGLPEWYWLSPGASGPITLTKTLGPVWVTLTASAQQLTITPGAGLANVTCPGVGNAYKPGAAAGCTYTYTRSSAGQAGAAYSASAAVAWGGTWVGSGGAGGTLPVLTVTAAFPVRVAEAQALNGGGR